MNTTVAVDRSAINERAYLRWLQRGCPDGSPDFDWFEAEQDLVREHATVAADAAVPAASVEATPTVSTAQAEKQKPAAKRSRGRRGAVETSSGPTSSTKPVAGGKRRATG
jgi:hypothetical protein